MTIAAYLALLLKHLSINQPIKTHIMRTIRLLLPATLLCTGAVIVSCGQRSTKKDKDAASVTTTSKAAQKNDSIPLSIDLSTGYAKTSIHKDSAQTVWASFDSPGNESLYGRIVLPASNAGNLRFNQIISPEGNSDGPFGRDISYYMTHGGSYTLAIGESLMQGDPYDGNFIIELYSGNKVPYEKPSNYFVRNDVDTTKTKILKLSSLEEFDAIFGMATTMSSRPTPIDFDKQFIVTVIGPPTDTDTRYDVAALMSKNGILTLAYNVTQGEKQSYTIRPFMMLSVNKEFDGMLNVVEPINF